MRLELGIIGVVLVAACGGGELQQQQADSPEQGPTEWRREGGGEGMSVSAQQGALDPHAVADTIRAAESTIQGCVRSGRSRLPYLGGSINLQVLVNRSGRASAAYLNASTMGDHKTEACILKVFRSKQWPRPVGGEVGEINQSYDFAAGLEGDDLRDWTPEKLSSAMAAEEDGEGAYDELMGQLNGCRKDAGASSLVVTMYIDEDGMAQAVGCSAGAPQGRSAVKCLETVVSTTSFPSNGEYPIKVTVKLN